MISGVSFLVFLFWLSNIGYRMGGSVSRWRWFNLLVLLFLGSTLIGILSTFDTFIEYSRSSEQQIKLTKLFVTFTALICGSFVWTTFWLFGRLYRQK